MSKKNLYVDFHVLQTVPPSCVNRDDTGSPKTAIYGGTMRARVSSQSWKHAMRKMFRDLFEETDLGNRTKIVAGLVVTEMKALPEGIAESDDTLQKKAIEALENAGISFDKKKTGTSDALFFMSNLQAKAIAQLALSNSKDKKEYKAAIKNNPSVDMLLFGRMVASDPSLNYDAAAQVAHSISTHTVHNEYDYFTAVDDCSPEDNAGAGHLGTVEFNSSTLYRYATVNAVELGENLCTNTASVIRKFADAFICSMPTGKQNTFANRTYPDMVYITIRNDQPVNLVGAFEKPVVSKQEGYVAASEQRFASYAKDIYERYASEPIAAYAIGNKINEIAQKLSLPDMLDALEQAVGEQLAICEES